MPLGSSFATRSKRSRIFSRLPSAKNRSPQVPSPPHLTDMVGTFRCSRGTLCLLTALCFRCRSSVQADASGDMLDLRCGEEYSQSHNN